MPADRQAVMVVDLAFGDCGKGTIVDFLTRRCGAHTIVRFNGGPQAAHNVVTDDGRHHTFAQIGSGAFVKGTRTLLSRFMLIEPYAMLNEAAHLQELIQSDPLENVMIDRRCPVITPAHQSANRLREIARANAAHGTCGMGVGELMLDSIEHPDLALCAADLANAPKVRKILRETADLKHQQLRDEISAASGHPQAQHAIETLRDLSWIEAAVANYAQTARRASIIDDSAVAAIVRENGTLIFEGSQGVLLDEWFGFHPHTTWSATTFDNARALLDETRYDGNRIRIGVLRSYMTRHGAGPMVTEDSALNERLAEPHNSHQGWAGQFRVGPFDAVSARYALAAAGGVDGLAITHLDRLAALPNHLCTAYHFDPADAELFTTDGDRAIDIKVNRPPSLAYQEKLTQALRRCRPIYKPLEKSDEQAFLQTIEKELNSPIAITSTGPSARDKYQTLRVEMRVHVILMERQRLKDLREGPESCSYADPSVAARLPQDDGS